MALGNFYTKKSKEFYDASMLLSRTLDNTTVKNWLLNVDSLGYKITAIEILADGRLTVYGEKKTPLVV